MVKLPEIVELRIAPPSFTLAGAGTDQFGEPGEDRVIVEMKARIKLAIDPSLPPGHLLSFTFALPSTETATLPLPHLQPLACESAAELLEAIASELRKTAAQ